MRSVAAVKFRTEIEIKPFGRKISYGSRILAVGSCFADNIAAALGSAKFNITANPAGVMFNPDSIARTLRMFEAGCTICESDLAESGERFFDYRFHGSFAARTAAEALAKMNAAVKDGQRSLNESDTVIITFGTAWVYILNSTGEVAANCHKQPSSLFTRKRLSVNDITALFTPLLEGTLKEKNVIFTVSPVRHIGDGFDENFLSKATLKLAVAELVEKFDNATYFPAYEIMNDDLRDYRFYADDLVHPSAQAVTYIREKFFAAALDDSTLALLPQVEKIVAAANHRITDAGAATARQFASTMLTKIAELEKSPAAPDLSSERSHFERLASR